jgi:hypothetical protein
LFGFVLAEGRAHVQQPEGSGGTPKSKDARWIDIHEGDFDEAQMATWVKQAAALPAGFLS